MRSPRSPASRFARATTGSTARLPQRHADQPLRAGRQLPPGEQPCHPGADAAVSRGQGNGSTRGHNLGYRYPKREFLDVDNLAAICIHLMALYKATYHSHTYPMSSHVNVGSGDEITIAQLATMLCRIIGYQGELIFDDGAQDGALRKLMDTQRLRAFGFHESTTSLENGLYATFLDFLRDKSPD